MPLTAEEKNQIVQGGALVVQFAIAPTVVAAATGSAALAGGGALVSLGALGAVAVPLAALALPVLGLISLFGPKPFPQGPTGKEIFGPVEALKARGLRPRLSRDPFFGDLVISTFDQDPFLDELVRNAAVRRVAAQTDFSDVLAFRQGVVEGLAETALERGFSRKIDPTFRGGVFRETADAPLQLVERILP